MRAYELMYIVRPDLDEESTQEVVDRTLKVIEENGGQVEKTEQMGKRRLAYEIKGYMEGFYVLVQFKSDTDLIENLEHHLRINDKVIRHLIVNEDE